MAGDQIALETMCGATRQRQQQEQQQHAQGSSLPAPRAAGRGGQRRVFAAARRPVRHGSMPHRALPTRLPRLGPPRRRRCRPAVALRAVGTGGQQRVVAATQPPVRCVSMPQSPTMARLASLPATSTPLE